MKRVFFSIFFVISFSFSASFEDTIKDLIEKQTGTKINVISTQDFKDNKNLKIAVIEVLNNAQQLPVIVTKDGGMVIGISNIFFTSSSNDESIVKNIADKINENNKNSQQKAASNIIKDLKSSQYVSIKSTAKNPKTYFIISDPNCGYCREELKSIDEKLKTHNVNMVPVGMLGEDSAKKSAYILSKVSSNMSSEDKVKLFRDVYSSSFKTPKNIDTSTISETTKFIFSTGVINGVPFIYEDNK